MDDCVFCNISNKVIDAQIVFEDQDVMVIKDILPKAPVHLLVIPREHIISINHAEPRHQALLGKMILTAKEMAWKEGVAEAGYKLVYNVGKDGGQVIPHLHLHLLGGKKFSE